MSREVVEEPQEFREFVADISNMPTGPCPGCGAEILRSCPPMFTMRAVVVWRCGAEWIHDRMSRKCHPGTIRKTTTEPKAN